MKQRSTASHSVERSHRPPDEQSFFGRLFVSLQTRRRKWSRAHDLVHFPLDQVESGKAGRRIRIAGGDFLRFLRDPARIT